MKDEVTYIYDTSDNYVTYVLQLDISDMQLKKHAN